MSAYELNLQAERLSASYSRLSGLPLSTRGVMDFRQQFWFQFLKAGFTQEDLEFVLTHLMAKIAKGERRLGAVRFSNLIERLDLFEEELGMARAEQRNRKPTPNQRELALQSFRPTVVDVQPKDNTKTASEAAEKALKALREWKAQEFGEKA